MPLIVRGIDLLGQPFEERTSTLALSVHGCRYPSKYHLPKNTWVTLETTQGAERRNLRARVAWIQRPHSVREFFQIAVELENPGNIWGIESPPANWKSAEAWQPSAAEALPSSKPHDSAEAAAADDDRVNSQRAESEKTQLPSETSDSVPNRPSVFAAPSALETESPLLREWEAQLQRQVGRAVAGAMADAESKLRAIIDEFEHGQADASKNFATAMGARQQELVGELNAESEKNFRRFADVLRDMGQREGALRAATESAKELAEQIARARHQIDTAEASQLPSNSKEDSKKESVAAENATAEWRQRLESEMTVARAQWSELLQSSLDSGVERLVRELSGRTQDLLREAETSTSRRLAEFRRELDEATSAAGGMLSTTKAALEQEATRGQSFLADFEQAVSRSKEYSAQLEAAGKDRLSEMTRRLGDAAETRIGDLNRRADELAAGLTQRLAPTFDSLSQKIVAAAVAEAESKLVPQTTRVSQLLAEIADREAQTEAGLRLYRERVRQVTETNEREVTALTAAAAAQLRNDLELARKEALAKWSEELDAAGARATDAASESIGRSSEWFQHEAQTRFQILTEQSLSSAATGFEEQLAAARNRFEAFLGERTSVHLAQAQQQLEGVAGEVTVRTRTQLDEAAEAAAASFGQVLRGISDQETRQFADTSHHALAEQTKQLDHATQQALQNIETKAGASVERFHEQMAAAVESDVARGRSELAAELGAALEGYRAERGAREKEWADNLARMSGEAAGKYEERLQTVYESWVASSVRRLNEHGQDATASLLRSVDQALRESCSRFFEGLSDIFQERTRNTPNIAGFTTGQGHDASAESPAPHNISAPGGIHS